MSWEPWQGHVTTTIVRSAERRTETGTFYYDVKSRKAMHASRSSCQDPFAALAAARRDVESMVDGKPCTLWIYDTPSHSASFCVSAQGVPVQWNSTYRYKTDTDGHVDTVSQSSILNQAHIGPLPLDVLGEFEACASRSASGIPWQCDCETNADRCTSGHFDVAECTRLVEIAEAIGFKDDDPFGSPGNLLSIDPMVSHTIGCYCCWGQGVQCGENATIQALRWSGLGLSGTIPSQIKDMSSLATLNLIDNNLTGSIPDLALPRLESFYASKNLLTGGFPTGTWPSLWRLYIDHNQLTGSLPSGLDKTMPALRRLGVNDNHFTGRIPSDIPFWNNTNMNQSIGGSIMCDFGGNQWSCPIEAWMRAGFGYSCGDVTCSDNVLV